MPQVSLWRPRARGPSKAQASAPSQIPRLTGPTQGPTGLKKREAGAEATLEVPVTGSQVTEASPSVHSDRRGWIRVALQRKM